MRKAIIGIVTGIAILAVSPAPAGAAGTASRAVSLAGFDLSKPDQLAKLQKRIARTAWSLCRGHDSFVALSTELDARRCVKEAIASGQPQIDRAIATALARRRQADSIVLASRP